MTTELKVSEMTTDELFVKETEIGKALGFRHISDETRQALLAQHKLVQAELDRRQNEYLDQFPQGTTDFD